MKVTTNFIPPLLLISVDVVNGNKESPSLRCAHNASVSQPDGFSRRGWKLTTMTQTTSTSLATKSVETTWGAKFPSCFQVPNFHPWDYPQKTSETWTENLFKKIKWINNELERYTEQCKQQETYFSQTQGRTHTPTAFHLMKLPP